MFNTTNPSTLETLTSYAYFSNDEIEKRLSLSTSIEVLPERNIRFLTNIAKALRENKQALAMQAALEMGKPIAEGFSEVEKCAITCEYYALNAAAFLQDQVVSEKQKVVLGPLGPLFAIMPWNFPYWQVLRFAAPALAVGNSILMKHSDLTAGCAQLLESVVAAACEGLPLLQNMRVNHQQAAQIIQDPRIRGVTFTGSSRGGREVASTAGKALKKCVLELGGSDAYVVFADADIDKAAEICAKARVVNNGQSCVAAKRFVVHEDVYPQFVKKFCDHLAKIKQGPVSDENTQRGPLASPSFHKQLQQQVQLLIQAGATRLWTGESYASVGAYFPAQVLEVNALISESFQQELFGPVAMIFKFKSTDEALYIANKSIYGLGGAVFSAQLEFAEKVARQMECGFVAINDSVRSDPKIPFGGVKDSGYGRELGRFGLLEFVNTKSLTRA